MLEMVSSSDAVTEYRFAAQVFFTCGRTGNPSIDQGAFTCVVKQSWLRASVAQTCRSGKCLRARWCAQPALRMEIIPEEWVPFTCTLIEHTFSCDGVRTLRSNHRETCYENENHSSEFQM
jgi:hypothetical protein